MLLTRAGSEMLKATNTCILDISVWYNQSAKGVSHYFDHSVNNIGDTLKFVKPLPLPLPHPPPHDDRPEHEDEHSAREVGGAHGAEPQAVRAEAAHRGAAQGIENEVEAEDEAGLMGRDPQASQDEEPDEVQEKLVYHHGMRGLAGKFPACDGGHRKLDAPGHRRGHAVRIAVHEVAETTEHLAEHDGGRHRVRELPGGYGVVSQIKIAGQHAADEAAVYGEAPLPDGEDLPHGAPVEFPVERDVIDSPAQDAREHDEEAEVHHLIGRDGHSLSRGFPLHKPYAGQHGGDVHEAVPSKRKGSDFEYDGAQISDSLPDGGERGW